jgi:hypothetical protein
MTPKEKAKELVEKFNEIHQTNFRNRAYAQTQAKQCALIAVDEILNVLEEIPDLKVEGNILLDKIEYYKGVLMEVDML